MTKNEIINTLLRKAEEIISGDHESIYVKDINDANLLCEAAELLIATPEWISVKDKLPETEEHYLCAFDDGVVDTVDWFDGGWELWVDSGKVTHWMPMPEPPKKEVTP